MSSIIILIPAIAGIISMAIFLPAIRKQMQMFCWPRLDAHFQDGDIHNALPQFGWAGGDDKKPANYFREPYVYYLAGKRYEGYQILPDMSTRESHKQLHKTLERLKATPDQSFKIFVNPDQPKESYLAVSNPFLQWYYVLIYAGLFGLSTIGYYYLIM